MKGYELNIKLENFATDISRVLIVPNTLSFIDLIMSFRLIFDFSSFHQDYFKFPGLNLQMMDLGKVSANDIIDYNGIYIKDYFDYFRRFHWVYDLGDMWTFSVKIKNTKKAKQYPFVKSFEGKYNPCEDFYNYFEEFMYCMEHDIPLSESFVENISYMDLEGSFESSLVEFNKDNINEKLKSLI